LEFLHSRDTRGHVVRTPKLPNPGENLGCPSIKAQGPSIWVLREFSSPTLWRIEIVRYLELPKFGVSE
jgi:hypothetical protein